MKVSEIRDRARRRREDYVMPLYLPFLPAILSLITGGISFVGIISGVGDSGFGVSLFAGAMVLSFILGIVSFVVGIYVLYKWISRRNDHFKRVNLLYSDVLDYLEEKGAEDVQPIKRDLREMETESDEKSAVLWIVLSIVLPPVILYVFHFLTKDFYGHQKRENFILEDVSESINNSGGEFRFDGYDGVKDRNTILYIVLSIITLGLFGLYWIYVLTRDPNRHFKQSTRAEKDLLASLESM